MARSIRSRMVVAVVAAVAGLAIFASAALAQNHGFSGSNSINSCFSAVGGIDNAFQHAFNHAMGAPVFYYGNRC